MIKNKLNIYLDNCCYNRPYDNQEQIRIYIESQAKLYIQQKIKEKKLNLIVSYILLYENSQNKYNHKKMAIEKFINEYASIYLTEKNKEEVQDIALSIIKSGIKEMDALHIASAILAKSDYFITTDDKILKYNDYRIKILSPCDFIKIIR